MAKLTLKALFTRARAATPLPPADVALSREAAEVELGAAEAAFDAAQAGYRAGLVDADDDTLKQLAQAQADAEVRWDRARALVDRFDAQLAAIRAAEAQAQEDERRAALRRTVDDAVTAMAAFQAAAETGIPEMIARARSLADLGDAAERARDIAIRALRDAGGDTEEDAALPATEAFRIVAGLPEKEIAAEEVELWTYDDGEIAGFQDEIRTTSDGSGHFLRPGMHHSRRYHHKRKFRRIEFLPQTAARGGVPLVGPLREIAKELGRLEAPKEPTEDQRRPEVRLVPLGNPVDVREVALQARRAEAARLKAERLAG